MYSCEDQMDALRLYISIGPAKSSRRATRGRYPSSGGCNLAMGQRLVDQADRVCGQPLQHVFDVRILLVAVDACRVRQLMIAAARWPARRLPAKRQFDRPMAIGRIRFSGPLLLRAGSFELGVRWPYSSLRSTVCHEQWQW